MAINFPATASQPTDGSFTYTDPTTGLLYFWDGSSWSSFGAPAGIGGRIQDASDFGLNPSGTTIQWSTYNTSGDGVIDGVNYPAANTPSPEKWHANSSTLYVNRRSDGPTDKTAELNTLSVGDTVTITDSVGYTFVATLTTVTTDFVSEGGTYDRLMLSFNNYSTWNSTVNKTGFIQIDSAGFATGTFPLQNEELLIYNSSVSQFKPGKLGIDDLLDVDTTTAAPTDGQALVWDNANSKWEPGTVSGGGGGTPGGNNEEVQYNSSGSFAGSNALKFSLNTTSVPNTATLVVGDNPGNQAQSFRGELVADNINAQGIITSINGAYFNGSVTVEGLGPNTSLQLVSGGSPVAILDNNYSPGTAGQVLSATGNDGSGNATGVAWATPSTLSGRQTASAQTSSIADGVAADLSITAAKSYGLITIQTSHAAWVTLYTDAASRTADASRTENTDALPGTGVIAEVITGGATTQLMTPGVFGFNNDSTPSTTVYAKVVNKSGSTQVITVTLTYTILEV